MNQACLSNEFTKSLRDPFRLCRVLWPHVRFYKKQREIIQSVVDNDETFVPAGNGLGKDFVAGFIALWFFLTRSPAIVVTTSADHDQLEKVLWGEMRTFLQSARFPLDINKGGPLLINHLHIRRVFKGQLVGKCYIVGRVAAKGEGMLGHHLPRGVDGIPTTLFVADEASGVDDLSYERSDTWAHRKLVIGNPFPCQNFFFKGVDGGNILAPEYRVST